MSIRALQDYTYYAKYARYNNEERRRETWHEACERVKQMHLRRYPQAEEEIEWAFDLVKQKRVLGSQRALQFGGKPIEKINARIYNCIAAYCDRTEFFQECFWLLLCGSGTGFSVQQHHIDKLPCFAKSGTSRKSNHKFVVPDTIEGWADALGMLIGSYLPNPRHPKILGSRVEFDYSKIRPAGSPLASGVGKAPGPDPLRRSLDIIRELLDDRSHRYERLRPIDAYDIVMHSSDAVLSGGVRRSACLCMFSLDDKEMVTAKTGNWFNENPQRARSNNSALLLRGNTTKGQFQSLIKSVREFGEPGFIWTDDLEALYNPCVEIALYGYDANGNSGWQSCNLSEMNGKKIKCREDFALAARGAAIIGTLQAGYTNFDYLGQTTEEIVRREALLGVSITGMMDNPHIIFDSQLQQEMAHLVVDTNEWMANIIGINPAARCTCVKPAGCRPLNALTTTSRGILTLDELLEDHDVRNQWDTIKLPTKTAGGHITKTFINGESEVLRVKLKYGIELVCTPNHPWFVKFKIDRNVKNHRVEINDWKQAIDLQVGDVLDISLNAYTETEHAPLQQEYRLKAFDKHLYNCVDITQPKQLNNDLCWLLGYLWGDGSMKWNKYRLYFIDEHKQHLIKAKDIIENTFGISGKIKQCTDRNAYTMEFGNKFLWYWLLRNGIYKYGNDGKISQIPRVVRSSSRSDILSFIAGLVDSDGHARADTIKGNHKRYNLCLTTANERFSHHIQQVAMSVGLLFSRSLNKGGINLQQEKRMWLMNLSSHVSQKSFDMLAANSIKIQNLPKGYIWKHEYQSPNKGILGKVHGVEYAGKQPTFDVETQENWFYAGAVKSHNTTSCILGTASGVHPHHARRYFRRVQANSLEPVFQHFKKTNSPACQQSVWSANKTDEVITFCVEVPDGAKIKNDLSAVQLLEHVKLTQQNWVAYGKRKNLCAKDWLNHNVSNTISVKNEEWPDVTDFIYENRKWFAGVSLLPASGDLDYPQAPMVNVHTPREILQQYGDGAILASGLIVDGLHAFDGNLWDACNAALGLGEPIDIPEPSENGKTHTNGKVGMHLNGHSKSATKAEWVRRVKQFADRYCDGDLRRTTYLLKDVNNWKTWLDLTRQYKDVDYTALIEETDETKPMEEVACSGGKCELV